MSREPFPYKLPLKYTDGDRLVILFRIEAWGTWVSVVGDPDNGSYEWTVQTPNVGLRFSDSGYGSPESALLAGLIIANNGEGPPVGVGVEVLPTDADLRANSRFKTEAQLRAYLKKPEAQ